MNQSLLASSRQGVAKSDARYYYIEGKRGKAKKIQKIFWFSPRLFVTLQLKRKRLCEDQNINVVNEGITL